MKKGKLPSLVVILILTLITSAMWVGLSVYRAFAVKPAASVPQDVSQELNPSLDTTTLSKVGNKLLLDDSQIPEIKITGSAAPASITATAAPQAVPTSTPIASSSATPSATPVASP